MKQEALTSEAKEILPELKEIKEIAAMKAYSLGRRATCLLRRPSRRKYSISGWRSETGRNSKLFRKED